MKRKSLVRYMLGASFVFMPLTLGSLNTQAAPASQEEQTYTQPDGTTFKATQSGDEFYQYLSGSDGNIYELGEDGYWHYQVKPTKTRTSATTDNKVGIDTKPTNTVTEKDILEKQLGEKDRQSFNHDLLTQDTPKWNKQQNLLVVMVEFNDVKLSTTTQEWESKIFDVNNKSLRNFYLDQTNQRIDVTPAKSEGYVENGVVKISMDQDHPDNRVGIGFDSGLLTFNILKQIGDKFDFSKYDTNKDNRIEQNELHIMVIVAGYERSGGNFGQGAWGHKGGINGESVVNGIDFNDFTMFGEKRGTQSSTIGVICHEFGHDLGLPDLYNTSGSGIGLGRLSTMAVGGSGATIYFNGMYWFNQTSGSTPVGLDAYSKMKLGVPVEEIDGQLLQEKKLKALQTNSDPTILKIQSQNPNEYYLIENRQLTGYDQGLEESYFEALTGKILISGGIAVYRVNTDYTANIANKQQLVTLLEADQSIAGYSRLENNEFQKIDPLYYNALKPIGGQQPTQINTKTVPSTQLADGSFLDTEIKVLSEPGNEMKVQIGTYVPITDIKLDSTDISINVGETKKIQASILPNNATEKELTWKSTDETVATVDSKGTITGKKNGTTKIIVSNLKGTVTSECAVNVKEKEILVDDILIKQKSVYLTLGETQQLTATVTPSNATNKQIIWSSSDETIASITKDGHLTAKKAGTAIIVAKSEDGNKSSEVKAFIVSEKNYYGTAPWSWDKETQTVSFYGGTFPPSYGNINIQTQIEKNALLEGKPIKKIQFCEKVTAHYQSSALFRSLSQLDEIEGLNLLDTSNVKFLDAIFEHSSVQHLDLSSWDTSNVETMTYAFRSSSISELDLSSWNLSKTTLLTGMFDSSKVSKLNISNWDTSNVTGMNYLFANTTELDSVDLKGWDTSNVTELNYLFNKSGVSSIDLSNFHTPKLKNATYMFANTPHLEKINIANLDTSLAGFNGKAMFQGAHQLNELTLGANFHFVSDAELSEGAIGVPIALWNSPKGVIHESSSLLMKEYDGTDTGTYRRKNGRKTYGGTFGSSPWFWDKETQTVSFYGGTFQASYGNINIQTQIEKNALLEGKPIKKIQFCEKVTAHYQSSALFRSLSQLDEIEGLNLLDTSNVKFLDAIFEHSSVQHLDLSSWDTSNVETMTYAFRSSSISELDLSSWNLSKTTLLTGMFDSSKVSKLNISNWDTSNVTGMNYLFANTTELDSVDLKGWDTSNVTELNYLFNKSGVSSIDLSNFHTPKLKNATYMFANTPHLEKINIANLDTSLAGFNGKAMFQGAHQLNELTLGANFHFVSDAELSEGAIGVPIALWNSPKGMIHESSSLLMKEYDGTDTGTYRRKNGRKTYGGTFGSSPWFWDKETQTVSFYGGTFQASYGNINIQTQIEKNALLEGKPIKKIQFCEKVTAHYQSSALFRSLSQLEEIEGLNLLDTSNVKFLDAIFEHSSVQHLDLISWDTSNVETMTYAFRSSSISELDLSSWNLSKTTLLTGMFDSSKVSKLNISNWDTSNVTGMNYLFANTTELDSVDLKGWDTSNVTELNYLFNKSGVSSIDLSNFHTPKLKNATYMFANTPHLEKINIANLDTSLAGFNGKAMFQGAHQLNELTLGANFHFVSDADLSTQNDDIFTGRWLGPNGLENPTQIFNSSAEFMTNYNKAFPGKYIRELK